MSEDISSAPLRGIEPPMFDVEKPSRFRGGCMGCVGGFLSGILPVLAWFALSQSLRLLRPVPAAVIVVAVVTFVAILAFRRIRRSDPNVAVGMLIGLALMGLLAGLCSSM